MKLCSCGNPAYRKGRVQDTLCADCRSKKANEWNKVNRRKVRHNELTRKFGITLEQYDELLRAQGGFCAICGETNCDSRALAVDHDHKTGKVRGLLCGNCNRGIGNLRDNQAILQRAIEYLNAYS
jgi:hypothetical protein